MRKHTQVTVTTAALLGALGAAQAATVLEMQNAQGDRTEMWLQGDTARIESDKPGAYMLLDLDDGSMQMVNDQEKRVLETPPMQDTGQGPDPSLDARLKPQGDGPTVAGYDTQHYVLQVGGKTCYDYYVSEDALAENDLGPFLKRMSALSRAGGHMTSQLNPCEQASRQMGGELAERGLPLRVVDANGKVMSEVVRVEADADPGDRRFAPPESYQALNLQQMMQRQMQRQPQP